jgi:hypothetical protein
MPPFRVFLCAALAATTASAQLPKTEIFLFKLQRKDTVFSISEPRNISFHKGYDSQPSFYQAEPKMLFVSEVDSNHTEIMRIDLDDKKPKARRITKTKENVYSPRAYGRELRISAIKGSEQRLASFNAEGKQEDTLFTHPDSLAYYTWYNDSTQAVAMVLSNPHKLVLLKHDSAGARELAQNVGRSMWVWKKGVLFVQHPEKSGQRSSIRYIDFSKGGKVYPVMELPGPGEDFGLHGDVLFTSDTAGLLFCEFMENRVWKRVLNESKVSIKGATRMVPRPGLTEMALVLPEEPWMLVPPPEPKPKEGGKTPARKDQAKQKKSTEKK